MLDLAKLSPEPWAGVRQSDDWISPKFVLARELEPLAVFEKEADVDFAALARNAFAASERRMREGWQIHWTGQRYLLVRIAFDGLTEWPVPCWVQVERNWQDSLTAWLKEQEAKRG